MSKSKNVSPMKRNSSRMKKLILVNESDSPKRTLENCSDNELNDKSQHDNDNEPQSSKELVVSKVKLNELKNWLLSYFDHNDSHQQIKSPFLILNGPSGSGKTITLKVLAKELKINIVQLPVTSLFDNCNSIFLNNNDDNDDKIKFSPNELNQMIRLKNFLHKFSQYRKSIYNEINNNRKILLIKEIPCVFLMKSNLLHDELLAYKKKFNQSKFIAPIVFIFTTTSQSDNLEPKILPKFILNRLNIKVITFKPISDSCLSKFIEQSSIGDNLNRSQIEEIVSTSAGDIGHALNYLKFKYSKSDNVKNRKNTKKIKRNTNDNLIECDRNESLTLSHAIAKILYAKRLDFREDHVVDYIKKYPNCDKNKLRNPLKDNEPEKIAKLANISYDQLIDWLYENYLDFIDDQYDLEKCFDCLQIICDSIYNVSYSSLIDGNERDFLKEIQKSIIIRGMLYNLNKDNNAYRHFIKDHKSNNNNKQINQFRPLNAPKKFNVNKILSNNRNEINDMKNFLQFYNEKDLIMDVLPFTKCFPHFLPQNINHDFHLNTISTINNSTIMEINNHQQLDDFQIEDDSDCENC